MIVAYLLVVIGHGFSASTPQFVNFQEFGSEYKCEAALKLIEEHFSGWAYCIPK